MKEHKSSLTIKKGSNGYILTDQGGRFFVCEEGNEKNLESEIGRIFLDSFNRISDKTGKEEITFNISILI